MESSVAVSGTRRPVVHSRLNTPRPSLGETRPKIIAFGIEHGTLRAGQGQRTASARCVPTTRTARPAPGQRLVHASVDNHEVEIIVQVRKLGEGVTGGSYVWPRYSACSVM